jgi:uncharacterized protein (TIRG00374 family)
MKRTLAILTPLVGLAIFVAIVVRTGPDRIAGILRGIEPVRLLWAPLFVAGISVARGARWRYVIRSLGMDYGLRRSTSVWMIGFFASAVTPGKAGDAVRALYLRNDSGRPVGETLLTVFVDRLWDLGFILVGGVATMLVFSQRYIQIPSVPLFLAAAALIAAAAAVATNRRWMRALFKPAFSALVPARHRGGLSTSFHAFYDALRVYGADPRRAAAMAAMTLACWALIFALAVYVARLLSIPVSPAYVLLMMPIVTLVELIPFSVSGLGTRDATVIYFFSVVGVGSAEAVGFSIVYVLIGTYLTALAGFALWVRHPVRWPRAGQP